MTKDQYNQLKDKITKDFGLPQWDMREPQNESARKLKELNTEYRMSMLAQKRLEAKENGKRMDNSGLKEIAESIKSTPTKYTDVREYLIPELFLKDKDLLPFTDKEKEILQQHYLNLNLTDKQLANQFQVSTQLITALLHSPAVMILNQKVFDKILPIESLKSLLALVKSKDSKITLEIARHYKLIQNETTDHNISTKPIEDPEAMKMLKDLGDKLAVPKDLPPMGTP